MSYLNELKAYLRDINLEILMESPDVKIDISKRYYNKFRLFYPSRRLIKYTTNIGGVLVGSRAIRCFTINGKSILERRVNDWNVPPKGAAILDTFTEAEDETAGMFQTNVLGSPVIEVPETSNLLPTLS